jgi:Tfp pilus assembly protein PilF
MGMGEMQNKRRNKFFSGKGAMALLLCTSFIAAPVEAKELDLRYASSSNVMAQGVQSAEFPKNENYASTDHITSIKAEELLPEEEMLLSLKQMIGSLPEVPVPVEGTKSYVVGYADHGVSYFKPVAPSNAEIGSFSKVIDEARKEMASLDEAKTFGSISPAGGSNDFEFEVFDIEEPLEFEDEEGFDAGVAEAEFDFKLEEYIEEEEAGDVAILEIDIPEALSSLSVGGKVAKVAPEEVNEAKVLIIEPVAMVASTVTNYDTWDVDGSMFKPAPEMVKAMPVDREAKVLKVVKALAASIADKQKAPMRVAPEIIIAKEPEVVDIPLARILTDDDVKTMENINGKTRSPFVKIAPFSARKTASRSPQSPRASNVITPRVRSYLDRVPADGFTSVDDSDLIKRNISIERATVRNPFAAADGKVEDPNLRKEVGLHISVTTQDTTSYDALTIAYQALIDGEFEISVANYSKVLGSDNQNIDAKFGIATAFHGLGQFERARNAYMDVLEADPRHEFALNNLMVLIGELSADEAMVELESLQKHNPGYAVIPAQIGMLKMKKRDFVNAARSLKRAVEIDPKNLDYRYNLAMLFEYLGGYDVSLNMYKVILNEGLKGAILPVKRKVILHRIEQLDIRKIEE